MTRLHLSTAGESHGPGEVCVLEGIPAGLQLVAEDIDLDLARRQRGYGRGGRMSIETDRVRFLAGVRRGRTLGTPIALLVENRDHANWTALMSPDPPASDAAPLMSDRVTVPRPGHADLAGVSKYGHDDVRNVLERASARETVARVAAGAVCKVLLSQVGVSIRARVVRIGDVACGPLPAQGTSVDPLDDAVDPSAIDWDAVESSPVACADGQAGTRMCEAIDDARARGESLGGIFEVWCWGICPGLGGYASYADRLDGRLMGALGSIPAIKGVEVGEAFAASRLPGSHVHDATYPDEDDRGRYIRRRTNRAGGLEGGMTTGLPIVLRAAMKPIPTLTHPLPAVDLDDLRGVDAHVERSDVTAVPAARVVGEAMAALVLATAYLEKFGGDSVEQFTSAVRAYERMVEDRGLWRR